MDNISLPKNHNTLEPILKLNEFEEAAGAILYLAKDQTLKNVQKAKDKAEQIIQTEKENAVNLEKEYLKRIDGELNLEKNKLNLKTKEELQRIENIPQQRIKQAADFILDKILPKAR